MNSLNIISDLKFIEDKIIFLILILPISLLAGSLVVNINILLLIIVFFFDLYKKKKFKIFKNNQIYFLLLLSFYLIFNSIFIGKTEEGMVRAFGFIRFIFLTLILAYYFNYKKSHYLNIILKFWFIIFIVVTFDLLFEYLFGINFLGNKSNYPNRLAGFTGDELKIGGYYFGFILISLSLIFKNYRKFFLPLLFFFILISFFIGEKSNFFKILFISYLLLIILYYKNYKFWLTSLLAIIIFVFSINSFNKNVSGKQGIVLHYFQLLNAEGLSYYFKKYSIHYKHYKAAEKIISENYIFGIGVKKFRVESSKKKYNPSDDSMRGATHPHQFHYEILSELGLIGYLLILGFLINQIYYGLKLYKKTKDILVLSSTLFVIANILPILPSGSFFTTYTATIFWINYSFILKNKIN